MADRLYTDADLVASVEAINDYHASKCVHIDACNGGYDERDMVAAVLDALTACGWRPACPARPADPADYRCDLPATHPPVDGLPGRHRTGSVIWADREAVSADARVRAAALRDAADRLAASGCPEWRPHHRLRQWADEIEEAEEDHHG
jgi:hypothetical protein